MRTRSLFFSLLAAVLSGPLLATTMEKLSHADLVDQSSQCLVATVVDRQSSYADGRFETTVTLEVEQYILGDGPTTVELTLPGGSAEVNGVMVGEVNTGAPMLFGDSRGVFFLSDGDSAAGPAIVGASQGFIEIVNLDGSQQVNSPDQSSLMTLNSFIDVTRSLESDRQGEIQ